MTIFQKNLQALSENQSELSQKVSSIQTNVIYEVFTDNNPINTNFLDNKTQTPIYTKSPAEETIEQFQTYDSFSYYPYLYFFGLGNGMLYKALLENQRLKKLTIFEPELEMIYVVLNLVDFSQELRDGRLLLLYSKDVTLDVMTHVMEEAKLFMKTYDLHQLLPYYDYAHEEMVRINKLNLRAMQYVLYSLGNDPKDALEGVENFIANLPDMVQNPKLSDALRAIKKSKTAIIVSTGPSLAKQLPLLKEIAPYVTIICIDASFPILYRHGIKPDVVVSLERVVTTSAFYKNVPTDFYEGVLFFISSLAHKGLLHSLERGIVQLSMRPFGYMSYFGLDEWGYIGIGSSAANMAFEIAFHAKFENVVFIGQDLAYGADGKSHSANHIFGENEIHASREYIQIEGYGGGHTVATTSAWKNFLDFFERNIPLVNAQIRVINATEGGARIHGTIEQPFAEVAKEILVTKHPKLSPALSAPDTKEVGKNIQKIEQKIAEYLSYGQKVQKQIEAVFLNVAEYLKNYEEIDLQNTALSPLEVLVAQIDTIKALLDDSTFTQLFHESYKSVTIQQEIENAPIRVMPEDTEQEKKEKYFLWVKAHRQWLFFLAGAVNATLGSIERGKSSWSKKKCFVSKVTLKNNYLWGYIYDIYSPSENLTVEICMDDAPIVEMIANRPQAALQILSEENRHHGFLVEMPVEFFDAKPHTLILRESISKEMLKHGYAKFQLGEADKVQGSTVSRNHVLYSGWCKKVGSSEKQLVDVNIDEQHVDTVIADRAIPAFKHLHGDEKCGFEFIIPEAYFDAKEHTIKFTPVANPLAMKENEDTFVLGEADLGKQREAMFMHSLEEVDPEKIKDLYSPNAIGFLATEENLADEEFVGYIKKLRQNMPMVKFKAFLFDKKEKKTAEDLFEGYNVEFILLKTVDMLIRSITVYIHNHILIGKYSSLWNLMLFKCENIYCTLYDKINYDMSLDEFDAMHTEHMFFQHPFYFSFSDKDIQVSKGKLSALIQHSLGMPILKTTVEAFMFEQIKLSLSSNAYRKLTTSRANLLKIGIKKP